MTHPVWQRIGDDVLVHDGWLRVVRRRYALPDGTQSDWELLDGFVAREMDAVASFHPMAHGGWVKHVVIARGCTPTGAQALDDLEDCVPVVLSPAEVRRAARAGELVGTDAVYLALDHAGLF